MKQLRLTTTRDFVPGGFFYLSIIILFVSFAFVLLSIPVWDHDFWWHLATGRYIVETGQIPHSDPFSFTSGLSENTNLYPDREKLILSQYWLAQVLFYGLYHMFGPSGIGIMRASLLLLSIFVVYRALKARGAMPYVSYFFIFFSFLGLIKFSAERPVLFTILGSVVTFVMIDDFERNRGKAFYFLPLLMLLWSNVHGGFIVGDAIILLYVLSECVKVLLGKGSYALKEMIVFFGVTLVAVGVSGINPNGFLAVLIAFSREYTPFFSGIQEYQTPLFLYSRNLTTPDYGFIGAFAFFPIVLLLRNKKFHKTHLVLLLCLAVAAASAVRYTAFFTLIACIVLGNELSLWVKEHQERVVISQRHLDIIFSIVMVVSSGIYLASTANLKSLRIHDSAFTTPIRAADFIEKNHLTGNVFNSFDCGGYLAWRFYPGIKTFIDTRALNYTVMSEYSWITKTIDSIYNRELPKGKTPLWERLLDHYKIDLIVLAPFDVYGTVLPIVLRLIDNPQWVPIYSDTVAVIFVRDIPAYKDIIRQLRVTPEVYYNKLIIRAGLQTGFNTQNPEYMESLGDIFVKMGKEDDAIKAYEYALKRLPSDQVIRAKLDILKKNGGKKDG